MPKAITIYGYWLPGINCEILLFQEKRKHYVYDKYVYSKEENA